MAVGFSKKTITPNIRIRSTRNRSISDITSPLSSVPEPGRLFKHVGRQNNPGRVQFLGELRPDARGCEGSQRPTFGGNSLLLKYETVLHADDVIFHAGDLADVGEPPCSVCETRDLENE